MKFSILIVIGVLLFSACRLEDKKPGERLKIVCTTGMIGDAVENIVGDDADVYTIMGPGTDPHLYKPTPNIIEELENADIIIHNGLHLEGKMGDVFEKLENEKIILQVSDGISNDELLSSFDGSTLHDPHIWFDLTIWSKGIAYIGMELADIDSTKTDDWTQNTEQYTKKIDSMHVWVSRQIESIPENQRILITSHDAFRYFGKRYDVEVKGLQGISTVSEFGLKDVTNMVDYIVSNKIKSVFVESSVSEKSMKAVQEGCIEKGHQLKIGGTLYSDAMGPSGSSAGNYLGMIQHNVNEIVKALK